jgi:hypothetical protein
MRKKSLTAMQMFKKCTELSLQRKGRKRWEIKKRQERGRREGWKGGEEYTIGP